MREELYSEIFAAEQEHWWFAARHRIVLHMLERYLPPNSGSRYKVADLGCGCGMMLLRLSEKYEPVGLDGSRHAIEFALRRGVTVKLGTLPEDVPLARESYDAVLMLDVLEHLKHDRASVDVAASLLRPGGILVCTVPAHMWLWTKFDEDHHHFRRYSKRQFRSLFDQPSIRLELLSHLNTILFAPAAIWRILATKVFEGDRARYLRLPPFNSLLTSIFAFERWMLGKVPMPIGLSFISIARKTENSPWNP
jgi:2-polyprenyl-3-methyl-5-hydroxy-6-metoxy-1,4-benzoquinol methylase